MDGRRKVIFVDSMLQLWQRLDRLPRKSLECATQIAAVAGLYGGPLDDRVSGAASAPETTHRACCRKWNWNVTAS